MENKKPTHTYVNIKNKSSITLDGIVNILSFDENGVSLLSDSGKIQIEGKNLKIDSLTKDDGVISVLGDIDGLYYEREKPEISFFKKIFG